MASEFLEVFHKIKSKHDEAFKMIDLAIRNEEEENSPQALQNYKKGVEIIDDALATPVGLPDDVESVKSEWGEACKMIHKLKRARAEVVQRIGILSETHDREGHADRQESSLSSSERTNVNISRPRTYSELAQDLRNLQTRESSADTLELIFSCDGVKLYHIKGSGVVTTTTDHSTLRVLRLDANEEKGLNATYFMQIIKTSHTVQIVCRDGMPEQSSSTTSERSVPENIDNFDAKNDSSWIYPLIAGVSPCFRTEYGAFIFPDLEAAEPGSSFGIVIPKDDNLDEVLLEILEAILHGVVTQLKEEERRVPRDIPTKVSENIVRGAHFVSQNLVKGAEKAGELISYSTPYLMSKIRSAPPDAPPVSNNVKTTVEVAKNVTGVAATCAGYITRTVAEKTNCLGRFLAPHIQRHGSTLLSKAFGLDESSANEKMSAALTIAAGAVEGFGTVYSGLEDSAKILGSNLSNNSVKIIEHRYGPSAGSLAAETFDTVGNVINLSRNVSIVKPQSFVKSAAKGAGRAVVQEMNSMQHQRNQRNFIPASSLYPDISSLDASVTK